MEASSADTVRIVSRHMVRPSYGATPMPPSEDIHLTPWDLYGISVTYIQRGILLPKPPAGAGDETTSLFNSLAFSLARALGRYYHFAGRLAVEEHGDGTVAILLRCTGEGAELVHAVAPGVAVADVVGSVYTPSSVVRAFFPLNGPNVVRGLDAAMDSSLPVVWAQVTELADGVFIGMSMNHTVGDGTSFWDLFNAWSAISRGEELPRAPAPVHARWFVDTSPHAVRRLELPPVREGFFTFSDASVQKLKARANDEMAGVVVAAISSLQALLAHLWRAVSRARRLPPEQEAPYALLIGCRGRMPSIPPGYVGNAIVFRMIKGCTVGEILDKGLGWTAWQLNRAVASFDEAATREWLDRWAREPTFLPPVSPDGGGARMVGSSSRFDVFGNDFGSGGSRWACGAATGTRATAR
ncbi:hypothetical protein QYE76_027691 [Lolium multiflorum]|uniref:Acetyltransferase n=1 Tax=Lolium multiflorum TaxID=4521 RepID=A0AAD8QN45_LOLMU|nr:hypothetical protein QYE76_027691 [Lolium multiflorum]